MIHVASATQKKTSETVVSDRWPNSAAVAAVAAEYMPNGNTIAHHTPANLRVDGRRLMRCRPK